MTILEEIKKYAEDCIKGEIVACEKHKHACRRLLSDCIKSEDPEYPYEWNEQKAKEIVDWFALFKHSKGVLAGTPIILTTWQKFVICQLYGWRNRKTGGKRFTKLFEEVARKNAKSQTLGGIALFELSVESTRHGEVYEEYTAGVKRDQSKIVFDECGLMSRGSILQTRFKFNRNEIIHIKSGSFLKPLSKDDGKSGDGTNGAVYILDEYHQHQNTDFYDLALGSNTKESLLTIITTAGKDLNVPCYQQEYAYCSNVINPNIDVWNDEYLIDIMELDPEDYADPYHIPEEVWIKANPIRMTYPEGRKKIRQEYEIACQIPEKMTAWLTKMGDVWVQAKHNGYMDMAKWKACEVKKLPIDLTGMDVYCGVDLSKKTDLTSVAWVFPYKNGEEVNYIVSEHSFIPNRDKLMEHIAVDHFPYDAAERAGLITVTDTPIVDQSAVMEYIKTTAKENRWNIVSVCYDPSGASKFAMDMAAEGYDMKEVYQSQRSLNEATLGFREAVYSGKVLYLPDALLNFCISNAVTRTANGMIKIDKDASRQRIDPVDAVLCAFKLAMYWITEQNNQKSILSDIDRFLEEDW